MSAPGVSKKLGRSGEGVSEKGEGVGRKGITASPAPYFSHSLAVSFNSCSFWETLATHTNMNKVVISN